MQTQKFIASDIPSAMQMVRLALGEDAVILSNNRTPDNRFEIIASLEYRQEAKPFNDLKIRESLNYHDVVDETQAKILDLVKKVALEENAADDRELLELAFGRLFGYRNILDAGTPFKLFMGVSGSGKSTAVAKVATKAKLKGLKSCIISTDGVRPGADSQLKAFADILEVDFEGARDERALFDLGSRAAKEYELVLVDTPGINPFVKEEVDALSRFVDVLKADVIQVMDASCNALEAVEISGVFRSLGAGCVLPTRLDLTRRIGSVLSVADSFGFKFCSAGVGSSIAAGLAELDGKMMAGLVLGRRQWMGIS